MEDLHLYFHEEACNGFRTNACGSPGSMFQVVERLPDATHGTFRRVLPLQLPLGVARPVRAYVISQISITIHVTHAESLHQEAEARQKSWH